MGIDIVFNVVLCDQLLEDFDWAIFVLGSSSYFYEAVLYEDGCLEFYFWDILLFDSIINELESYGFVQFEIEVLFGLDENILVENIVGIYFDFNLFIIINIV